MMTTAMRYVDVVPATRFPQTADCRLTSWRYRLHFVQARQADRAGMLSFLYVIPYKTVLKPSRLPLREVSVSRRGRMGYGKSLATFVTHNCHHYYAVRHDHYGIGNLRNVRTQPFGCAI